MPTLQLSIPQENPSPTVPLILSSGDTSLESDRLLEGLPAEEVHRRALSARKALGKAERALCFWLVEIDKRRLYREFGCSSTFHYAETYLELAPNTIYDFLRTGRELENLPLLAEACAEGRIAPSKVREISRVARPETEELWLKVGTSSSCREVEKLVALTPKGGLPPTVTERREDGGSENSRASQSLHEGKEKQSSAADESESSHPGTVAIESKPLSHQESQTPSVEGVGPSRYRCKLVVELEGEQMELVQRALDRARKETGKKERGVLLEHMARMFLQGNSTEEGCGDPPYRVTLHSIPEAKIAWIEGENVPHYVTEERLKLALCDCEILDLRTEETPVAPCSGKDHTAPVDETAISGDDVRQQRDRDPEKFPTWGKTGTEKKENSPHERYGPRLRKSIPGTLRRKVMERDGHRCCLCHRRMYLSLHHIKPVGEGGRNLASNLCLVCWVCHEALHDGRLTVEGIAPHGLIWRNSKGEVLKGSMTPIESP